MSDESGSIDDREPVEEFDSKAIEEELLAKAEANAEDPMQQASAMFGLYMPKFKQGVDKLSSRAKSRVLKALIEYPLNEKAYQHSSHHEKEMVAIGDAVLQAKFLMVLTTMHSSPELDKAMDPNIDLTDEEVAGILEDSVVEETYGEHEEGSDTDSE